MRLAGDFDCEATKVREKYSHTRAAEASARTSKTYVRPWDTAENTLKREAYLLITRFLAKSGGRSAIKWIVRVEKKIPRSPTFNANPFYWGLLAIDPKHGAYNKAKISLYAPLLKYAYRNNVPPAYLIGFLLQVGRPKDIKKKVTDGSREVGLAEMREHSFMTE